MANTRETMGEQACLDALVANTLTSFEDDGVTKVGANCLRYHTALTDVKLPQCKSVEPYGLAGCTNLEVVDMLGSDTIMSNAFNGDTKLAHLLLRGASKTTLSASGVFSGTPISSGNGAIYVPSDLLAAYKADNNWKNYFITTLDKYPTSDYSSIDDDWPTIIAKAEAGTASESYSIGDTKLIDLGTEGRAYAQIVAFNTDPLTSDGTKTAGVTFVTKKCLATNHYMNQTDSSGAQGTGANGGWEHSEMRTYLNETIYALLPSELQSAIKSVTKYSDNIVPGETTVTHDQETQDKLWIPSAREIFGGSSYEQTGPKYTSFFNGNTSRTKYNNSNSAQTWWLRSASGARFFRMTTSNGYCDANAAYANLSVVIGFCI